MTLTRVQEYILGAFRNVDFDQSDWLLLCAVTVIIYILHFIIEEKGKALNRPHGMSEKNWDRCCKDIWRLSSHSFMCISSFIVLWRLNLLDLVFWPRDVSRMWFTVDGIPAEVKYLYIFHIANYTQDYVYWIVVSLPSEVVMMIVHHTATLILIIASFVKPNNWAGGLIVMTLHEPSDVLLAISKQFYYRSSNQLHINICFCIFSVSWVYLRLFVLAWVLVSLWYNPLLWACAHAKYSYSFLVLLWFMHLVWWIKIMHVMSKVCRGKKLPDVRHDGFQDDEEFNVSSPKDVNRQRKVQ